jgi:uncharacterized protein YggE
MAKPMENSPDVLTIEGVHEDSIEADGADIFVSIEGSALFSGAMALKRSKEVARLVEDLAAVSIEAANISLQDVRTRVEAGLVSKSSTAIYRLKIALDNLERLADVVGAVNKQKEARLERIEWRYDREAELRLKWLDLALDKANAKAKRVASALNVKLLGVHRFSENPSEAVLHRSEYDGAPPAMAARARGGGVDFGMEVTHTKRVHWRVMVDYLVGRFGAA